MISIITALRERQGELPEVRCWSRKARPHRAKTAPTACIESAMEGRPSFVAAQDYADLFHGGSPRDRDVREVIGIIRTST